MSSKKYKCAKKPFTKIHKQYIDILSKSKFISKQDEWYIENTEANIVDGAENVWFEYPNEDTPFNKNDALFVGMTDKYCKENQKSRLDEEVTPLDEFKIIYNGIDISEMTLRDVLKGTL